MPRKTAVSAAVSAAVAEASMRPRPDAAENGGSDAGGPGDRADASMRPRPDAAENCRSPAACRGWPASASMRPRPDAAENGLQREGGLPQETASMRPRPDAAENPKPAGCTWCRRPGFNEAAARCRGKRDRRRRRAGRPPCFNEAAARCRGKLADIPGQIPRDRASMRPRPDAAENGRYCAGDGQPGQRLQ